MLNGFKILLKAGVGFAGCAAVIGLAQATTLTPIVNNQGNMSWQNIGGASYTFADTNHNGQLNVNETVTFVIDMQKSNWGTHDFDALKVWVDHAAITLEASKSEWHYDPSNENQNGLPSQVTHTVGDPGPSRMAATSSSHLIARFLRWGLSILQRA